MSLRVAHSLEEWAGQHSPAARSVVAIGNFDGLHRGHQHILHRVVRRARELQATAAAITFDPHPLKVLRPDAAPPLINTITQRLAGLEEWGLDAVLVLPFTVDLSRLAPEAFVKQVLVNTLHVQSALVGQNFRFGHKHAGDVALLREMGASLGFEVETVLPVTLRRKLVSSTAVREAVRAGSMTEATRLLGRLFSLTGTIEAGSGTGRRVVVPTLNLAPQQELLPARGVYVTETWLGGDSPARAEHRFRSVTNVGVRPTFGGERLTVESHLFDFSGEMETDEAGICFWRRLREEKKFASAADLLAQVKRDMATAQKFFRRLGPARA